MQGSSAAEKHSYTAPVTPAVNGNAPDVVSMAQERMVKLMSEHKQAEIAKAEAKKVFSQVVDTIREQATALNGSDLQTDLDITTSDILRVNANNPHGPDSLFAQDVTVTSRDRQTFSFMLFADTSAPPEALQLVGKVDEMQEALDHFEKLKDGPVLSIGVRNPNTVPGYEVVSAHGPVQVQGKTASGTVMLPTTAFGAEEQDSNLTGYIARHMADVGAQAAQADATNKGGAYSRTEIGFTAEPRSKKTVERPHKKRAGFKPS